MITDETKDIITIVCNIFTAIGTVGAVIVALWPKKPKPHLSVYATVSVEFTRVGNKQSRKELLSLKCINKNNQPIHVTGFSLSPNRFKFIRISPTSNLEDRAAAINRPPITLQYSENINQYYSLEIFRDPSVERFISKNKIIASYQLKYLWQVIAHTNIKEFKGKLANSLVKEVLELKFPSKKANITPF